MTSSIVGGASSEDTGASGTRSRCTPRAGVVRGTPWIVWRHPVLLIVAAAAIVAAIVLTAAAATAASATATPATTTTAAAVGVVGGAAAARVVACAGGVVGARGAISGNKSRISGRRRVGLGVGVLFHDQVTACLHEGGELRKHGKECLHGAELLLVEAADELVHERDPRPADRSRPGHPQEFSTCDNRQRQIDHLV